MRHCPEGAGHRGPGRAATTAGRRGSSQETAQFRSTKPGALPEDNSADRSTIVRLCKQSQSQTDAGPCPTSCVDATQLVSRVADAKQRKQTAHASGTPTSEVPRELNSKNNRAPRPTRSGRLHVGWPVSTRAEPRTDVSTIELGNTRPLARSALPPHAHFERVEGFLTRSETPTWNS
jgi:hypothetical protein